MVVIKDGKTYYTMEESIKIGEEMIEKTGDELLKDLNKIKARTRAENIKRDTLYSEGKLDVSQYEVFDINKKMLIHV